MSTSLSRRRLLAGLGLGTVVLACAPDRPGNVLARGRSFPDGVGSGGVRADGATLWTRIANGGPTDRVQLIVSENADLSAPVAVTEVGPDPDGDGRLHAPFTGGAPGRQYFYRFDAADSASDVGRFRTLRPADSAEPIRVGFFTCQAFVDGFYGAHRHLAAEDLDLVVCLGDYVYESGGTGPYGRADPNELEPGRGNLADYRGKYRLYRTDAALRALHAAHAMLPLYDDHELVNNWWRDGDTGAAAVDPAGFAAQKAVALQAWSENMPVPVANPPQLRTAVRLGRHAELFSYDARMFRDAQPCGDGGSEVCPEADAPGRTMLGAEQKQSLLGAMTGSDASWKVLASQGMVMNMLSGSTDASGLRLGDTAAYLDTWDGYTAERTEVLSTLAARGNDLVVVTGDDHDTFAGELWDTGSATTGTRRAGVEFVVPSVTSANGAEYRDGGEPAARAEEQNRLARNPHLKMTDMVQHGYGTLTVTPDEAAFAFRRVDKTVPDAPVTTSSAFTVARGAAELNRS